MGLCGEHADDEACGEQRAGQTVERTEGYADVLLVSGCYEYVLGDEQGWVRGLRCVEMTLGEPDESGRRRPVEKEGSEFDVPCDVVIMALGTSPNPLLAATTSGLETDRRGCLTADAEGRTTRAGVFAGGDAVTGAATVILAMGAGRRAARAIDEYIRTRS